MKRKRKKRTRLSVSLFPFLAVLICTLGVLIVMLVMAAKSADMQAEKLQSDDDQRHQARIDELEGELDLRQVQAIGMEMVRPKTVIRLEESRANRSHIENEIRKLKTEFKRVGIELLELHQNPESGLEQLVEFSEQDATTELDEIRQQIATASEELKRNRESLLEPGTSAYMIVPYRGSGGTFRRPIFIECTKDAITIQPSGIRLAKSEFAPPLAPGNALDSALLAVREYWRRYDLAGDEGNAYPLIVVRPGGAETFVLARHAMKSWDDEFGYELVEEDTKLDFGKSDPQLNAEILSAIQESRRRQTFIRRQIANRNRGVRGRPGQLGRDGSGAGSDSFDSYSGFVSSSGERLDGRMDPLGAAGDPGGQSRNEAKQGSSSFVSFDSTANRSQENPNSSFDSSASGSPSQKAPGSQSQSQSSQSRNQSQSGGEGGDLKFGNPYEDLSVAKKRGSNWALPTQTAGGTPYVRPIRVVCGPDALEIRNAVGQDSRIPMTGSTQSAIDPLVGEVWKQIDSWGIAGESSYWKPQLRFVVLPGGEQRFEQLKGLLFQSGIMIKESNK